MAQAIQDREQSLISSEQRFRNLVNSIDGVVWELDVATGRYLFVSDRSLTLLGHPPSQWQSDPGLWSRYVHPADLENFARLGIQERRDLARNNRHDLEYRIISAEVRRLGTRLVNLVGAPDQPSRLLGVMISIMDRKRAEAELARYGYTSRNLVTQLPASCRRPQNELVQKERLAVLGQLTATVSHEIRNPLGTVSNALYMLRETLGSECLGRIERPLALAERGIQRCDGIISELSTSPFSVHWNGCQCNSTSGWPEFSMRWSGLPSVHCDWHLACGATVLADPERLRRALVNVVVTRCRRWTRRDWASSGWRFAPAVLPNALKSW